MGGFELFGGVDAFRVSKILKGMWHMPSFRCDQKQSGEGLAPISCLFNLTSLRRQTSP